MAWRWLLSIILGLLVLQSVVLPTILPLNVRPDLLLLLVVNISLFYSRERAIMFGFVLGVIQDSFSNVPLGAFALAKSLVAFFVHTLLATPLVPENKLVHIMGIVLGLAIQNAMLFVIMVSTSNRQFALSGMYTILGLEAIYTLIAYPVVFWVFSRIRKRKKVHHAKEEWF